MDEAGLRDLLDAGSERRSIEFKSACALTDTDPVRKIIRACLGLANTRDGGVVVLGAQEAEDDSITRQGVDEHQAATWNQDDVADQLARYAAPSIAFGLRAIELDGRTYVVLEVAEFDIVPVLCTRDYPDVLRSGACYVRSRKKVETVEVSTYEDMRELIDLATEKRLAAMLAGVHRAGGAVVPDQGAGVGDPVQNALDQYDAELQA